MSLFIESIRLDDGNPSRLSFHQDRINRAQLDHYNQIGISLIDFIQQIKTTNLIGRYKLRIIYNQKIQHYEIIPYQARTIEELVIVETPKIQYPYKYEHRDQINKLTQSFQSYQDIIIVKNGVITDSSYSNLAFQNHSNEWVTPSAPLLEGTHRSFLIQTGQLNAEIISLKDLNKFKKVMLINAMLDWEEIVLPIEQILIERK